MSYQNICLLNCWGGGKINDVLFTYYGETSLANSVV